MPLPPEILDQIALSVRSGFYTRADLMPIFCEERYEPGELDPDEVSDALDTEIRKLIADQEFWPALTDCDRLDTAFLGLDSCGIIALQNAGYTQSDGYSDCGEVYHERADKGHIIGYCFYHRQDLERAVRGEGLLLAFGPCDPLDEKTKGPEIGRIISDQIGLVGLPVEWDGTVSQRISIPRVKWQRRFPAD